MSFKLYNPPFHELMIGENYATYLQKPWFDEFIDNNKFYEKCKSNMISITVSTLLRFLCLFQEWLLF